LDHNLYPVPDAQGNITRLAVFTQDVTEQRLAEEALRESEERYRTLVEAMSEGVLMHKDDRMAYVNDSFCEMLGYSPDELAKIRPGTLIDDEDRKRLSKRLDEPTPSKRTTYGVKWRKKDGTKLPTMTSLRHIYDAAGQLSGAVAVVTDISLQMQAEKALRTSEERYRSFFENSPISLWELDFSEAKNHIDTLRGRRIKDLGRYLRNHPELLKEARRIVNITDVNQATLDLLQAESKEKVLHSAGPFLTKASRKAFDDVLISLIEGDTSVECESEVITGKGEIRYVVARLSLIPTYRDTWEKVLVSVVDITDRRRAEQALRESEQHYRELFENAPMPVFEEDCTGSPPVILRANRRAEETYGCSFEEQTPFPVKQLVPSTNLNDYEGAKKMLMAGKSVVLETKNIRPDGSVFPVRVSATVSPTSGPKRTIVMVEDITDQERVREILHTANQRLVQAREQEWRRLAGDLHDSIGQGLVALKLHLQNATTEGKAPDVKTRSNAKAEPTNMCDALIREVRSMCYRLYPPALESVGLLGAMRQLIDQARQKMRVTMQCRGKIRTARFSSEVETALFRITQEALNNAMRHSQAEHVNVELSHNKGVITLKVSDNGVGFEKDEALGRGLGLNTMRERAYAAGGDIKITSSHGKTVIRATIPAEPVQLPGE
jgi:PAS domain S-box-containing protein